ncbi:MAG TPA: hypothetical protein VGH28_28850 [Polyangiaceae bacterium]|jgi:hypothetical protein
MRKAILLALILTSAPAVADESTRRPFFIQGTLGSFGLWTNLPGSNGTLAYWHPDFEFGYHFSGRHDGVEIGIRQGFYVGRDRYDVGETLLRGGYDFAFPFRNGRFELTVAPYGTFGLNYLFTNVNAGLHWSVGIEAKLFFFHNLYLLVRPVELAIGQYFNLGPFAPNVYFNMNAGIGAGLAF